MGGIFCIFLIHRVLNFSETRITSVSVLNQLGATHDALLLSYLPEGLIDILIDQLFDQFLSHIQICVGVMNLLPRIAYDDFL